MYSIRLLLSVCALRGTAMRVRKALELSESVLSQNCACASGETMTCSSCSMQPEALCRSLSCHGQSGADAVCAEVKDAFRGGGNEVVAWKASFGSKGSFFLKFKDAGSAPLKAARVAHLLGIVTPRQVRITRETCPELASEDAFVGDEAESFTAHSDFQSFLLGLKYISIQEAATDNLEVPIEEAPMSDESLKVKEANIIGNFWYRIGLVAALDWIIGKADLFNDVPLNFQDTQDGLANLRGNLGNLILIDGRTISEDKVIAIDLDVDMPRVHWDNWSDLLGKLVEPGVHLSTWVTNVLMPVTAYLKGGGGRRDAHGKYSIGQAALWEYTVDKVFSGERAFDNKLAPLLVQAGMVDALLQAESIKAGNSTEDAKLIAAMPGIKWVPIAFQGRDESFPDLLSAVSKAYHTKISEAWLLCCTPGKVMTKCQVSCEERFKNTFGFLPWVDEYSWNRCEGTAKEVVLELLRGQEVRKRWVMTGLAQGYYHMDDPNEHDCASRYSKRGIKGLGESAEFWCRGQCSMNTEQLLRVSGFKEISR